MKKATSKSPIKEPLLRLPGQSIDEEMHRLSTGQGVPCKACCVVPWMVCGAPPEGIFSVGPESPGTTIIHPTRAYPN